METKIQRVVFWQNVLSIHQSAFVRALAARPGVRVWFAYEEDLPAARKAMGWTEPDYGAAQVADVRDPRQWKHLVAMNDETTCHAFGSYFLMPRAYAAFKVLRRSPCPRVWTSEAFDFHGWKGWIRFQRARWHILREAGSEFNRVLAMGGLGVKFFEKAGIKAEKLREFGYLVESPAVKARDPQTDQDGALFQFLFVGQLIRRKGVDLLLRAASCLPKDTWSLDLIGDGVDRHRLTTLAAVLGLSSQVRFLGNQTNAATLTAIRSAGVLVLPSRWDGWGAVVNEALMLGTPAIVSDACGAASLIANDICGWTFRRADTAGLAGAMGTALNQRAARERQRERLRNCALAACAAEPLVTYFLNCMNSTGEQRAQLPPWRLWPSI